MLLSIAIALALITLLALALRPIAGVALLFISKPIIDANWDQLLVLEMPLTQVFSGLVPIVIIGRMLIASTNESLREMPLKWIWLVYVSHAALFSLFILYNQDPKSGANIFLRYMNGFVGFYMLQAFFQSERHLKIIFLAMMIGGLFPIGIGLYQIATGATWQSQDIEGLTRNVGMYHDAITVRHYAMQTILATLLFGSMCTSQNIIQLIGRTLYMLAATLVMAKAYSKAGFLTLGIWVCGWNALHRRLLNLSLLATIGILAGTYYGAQHLDDIQQIFHKEIAFLGGTGEANRTFNGRWYIWQEMADEWSKFDWPAKTFGSGKVAVGAHNDYFQMLFHGGVAGLLIYLTLLSMIGLKIISNLKTKCDPLTIASLLAFLSWLIDTIGLVPSTYSGYQWFVWGIIGLGLRQRIVESSANLAIHTKNLTTGPKDTPISSSSTTDGNRIARKYPILWNRTNA